MYKMILIQVLERETLDLEFPELPEEIEIKFSNDNKKYNVLALGDVITAGEKGLKDFSIKSLFPADEAETYIKKIGTMINNKKPMRFILSRKDNSYIKKIATMINNKKSMRSISNKDKYSYDDINIPVVIDEFSYKEEGGEGDVSFTLKFTEFRDFKAKVIE